jgi:hypothetical protein
MDPAIWQARTSPGSLDIHQIQPRLVCTIEMEPRNPNTSLFVLARSEGWNVELKEEDLTESIDESAFEFVDRACAEGCSLSGAWHRI